MASNIIKAKVKFTVDVEVPVGTYYGTTSFDGIREQAVREGAAALRKALQEYGHQVIGEPKMLAVLAEESK